MSVVAAVLFLIGALLVVIVASAIFAAAPRLLLIVLALGCLGGGALTASRAPDETFVILIFLMCAVYGLGRAAIAFRGN